MQQPPRSHTQPHTMPKRKRAPHSSSKPPKKAPKSRSGIRHASVYDAVANRVNYEGFVNSTLTRNAFGEKHKRSQKAMPADEVLGRRKNAPEEPIPYGEVVGLPDSVGSLLSWLACWRGAKDWWILGPLDCGASVCGGLLCGEWDGGG